MARINNDFIDHLHSRIFSSFARKGFDDHEWLPDADLRLLLSHADSEEAALRAEEMAARAEAEREKAAGGNDHKAKGLLKKAEKKAQELETLRKETAPFRAERARRNADSEPVVAGAQDNSAGD